MTLLAEAVRTSARVAATPSRLQKIEALAHLLRSVTPAELEPVLGLLSGEPRQGKLSLGFSTLQSLLGNAASVPVLTVGELDAALEELARVRGAGAAAARRDRLGQLFARATAEEQDFLRRLLVGELRQGALEGLMGEAVARAAGVSPERVRRAAAVAGGLGRVAAAALSQGEAGLAGFAIRVMQPVHPMLAQPAADAATAAAALGSASLEWKLDGARVQVHKRGDEVRVFTRNLNDVSDAVPEVVAAARSAIPRSLVLDGEAIALRADGTPQPFQATMRRFGRKRDDPALRERLPLSVFFFDCLLADDTPLLDRPLGERHAALAAAVAPALLAPRRIPEGGAQAEAFFGEALARGHEGIVAKGLASAYEAGRRSAAWLKVKRAHTLDLVVLAAEWGHGRRRGRLSNLHLGARDAGSGGFVMLGKTFKGLTDEVLEWQTRELLARETGREGIAVRVRPELVVEVAFDGLQQSPQYPAGLALRFARVKAYRPDKRPEEADTLETVRRIHALKGAP